MNLTHSERDKVMDLGDIIGIWGGGLIGLSTAAHYARKGIKSIIYDIDESQVSRINNGQFPANFEKWIGFPAYSYVSSGQIRATLDTRDFSPARVKVHFVAVPTEKAGEPYMDAIKTVLRQIADFSPQLCIVESTIVPGQTESLGHEFMLPLGVATRRDWFTSSANNLENCVRVYCGLSDEITGRMEAVLSLVCKNLARASSCTVVELTKCLDNGIFQTVAMYASQTASAYPNGDVAESLRLAATHWRLGNHVYFPSLGTGGPCVPLANKYLLAGATHPDKLSIASEAIQFDIQNPLTVANTIKQELVHGGKVAVLGICYRGDIKVHAISPHLRFTHELVRLGVQVGVHDFYYTETELKELTGATPFTFPDAVKDYQFIYVGSNHTGYTKNIYSIPAHLSPGQTILDNEGIWEALAEEFKAIGIHYYRVGSANWLRTDVTKPNNVDSKAVADDKKDDTVVFQTKFFKIRGVFDPRLPSSDPWYILDRPNSVTIIASSPQRRFLLQNQYRPAAGRSSWEFPGGNIDPKEEPEQAAKRELFEETGLKCDKMQAMGWHHPVPGMAKQRAYVFLAHVSDEQLSQVHSPVLEEGILSFRIVDVPKFRGLTATAEVVDGFTLSAFTLWQNASGGFE